MMSAEQIDETSDVNELGRSIYGRRVCDQAKAALELREMLAKVLDLADSEAIPSWTQREAETLLQRYEV